MDAAAIHQRLKEKLGAKAGELTVANPDPYIVVEPNALHEVCELLRREPGVEMEFLESIAGVECGEELQLVYHLLSYTHRHAIVIKLRLPNTDVEIPSMCDVWPAANWHEREQYDLFGFVFAGHPDLRRIMLPEDWVGHPLRKDYKHPDSYHGIEHARPSVLEQLKPAPKPVPKPAPKPAKAD